MDPQVRDATDADLDRLAEIERAADEAFTARFDSVDWGEPPNGHERARSGFVLVASEQQDGDPIGFVHVIEDGDLAHLEQVSVLPSHARRGWGRRLVEEALAEASDRGHERVTLRAFADVPWNAPFYESLGFVIADAPDRPFYNALAEAERGAALDRHGRRVHMVANLGGMTMDAEAFEALVVDELDKLPDEMVEGLDNIVFVVEDEAEDDRGLFGLYEGLAITERGQYGLGELPDRIVVFRHAHLAASRSEPQLRREVRTTLVHEIAHFYGIDDEQLQELGWA